MARWLPAFLVIFAAYLFSIEAAIESAKRKGAIFIYRAPVALRILFYFFLLAMIYGTGAVALSKNVAQEWWVAVLLVGLAIFVVCCWPADLELSASGIRERKWLGLRTRGYSWTVVVSATPNPGEDSVDLVTTAGATIKHTKYHVDRAGFVAQVKAHCLWLEPGRRLE